MNMEAFRTSYNNWDSERAEDGLLFLQTSNSVSTLKSPWNSRSAEVAAFQIGAVSGSSSRARSSLKLRNDEHI